MMQVGVLKNQNKKNQASTVQSTLWGKTIFTGDLKIKPPRATVACTTLRLMTRLNNGRPRSVQHYLIYDASRRAISYLRKQ
jgi:hypothetical protein